MISLDVAKVEETNTTGFAETNAVTIVGFYGTAKPPALHGLVSAVSAHVQDSLKDYPGLFCAYPIAQVHATLMGIEGHIEGDSIVLDNARTRALRFGVPARPFDVAGLLSFLRQHPWPLRCRFGGHAPIDRNPYDPGHPPWGRTFDVQPNGLAVLMGWPCSHDGAPFAPGLLGLRKALEAYGAIHKYHIDPAGQDNDLFLRLGGISAQAWRELAKTGQAEAALTALVEARDQVRQSLLAHPTVVDIELRDLSVVRYRCTTLARVAFCESLTSLAAGALTAQYECT